MTVKINNNAAIIEKKNKNNWYRWKVFVDEDESKLNDIEDVTYVLHSSFPEPVKVVGDRNSKFALEQVGCGEFDIECKIKYKDGKEEDKSYHLDLSK